MIYNSNEGNNLFYNRSWKASGHPCSGSDKR
jgi:hypothetical protein